MNAEKTWNNMIARLNDSPEEIATVPRNSREPLWFCASIENGNLYIYNAAHHRPSTSLTKKRRITKSDFEKVYSYYFRLANGESNLVKEVAAISMNSAYIYALIARFE